MHSELSKFKKQSEENVEKYNIINTNLEKIDRTDKIIRDLVSTIKTMRVGNEKMQEELGKNLQEFQEKFNSQESIIDEFEKFEVSTNKKLGMISEEFKILRDYNDAVELKLKSLEDTSNIIITENINLQNRFKEELSKIESNLIFYLFK
jgi:hypothetical protein